MARSRPRVARRSYEQLVGGIAAVFLTGGVVSIASLVGFVTLFGIAMRNGILLIAHFRHLLAAGASKREAVLRGSLERLAPILMTALTAGLALMALALGGGEPGKRAADARGDHDPGWTLDRNRTEHGGGARAVMAAAAG